MPGRLRSRVVEQELPVFETVIVRMVVQGFSAHGYDRVVGLLAILGERNALNASCNPILVRPGPRRSHRGPMHPVRNLERFFNLGNFQI